MSQSTFRAGGLVAIAFVVAVASSRPGAADSSLAAPALKNPAEFSSISNPAERSRAIFNEIGKVLTNPRCMNCHPAGAECPH